MTIFISYQIYKINLKLIFKSENKIYTIVYFLNLSFENDIKINFIEIINSILYRHLERSSEFSEEYEIISQNYFEEYISSQIKICKNNSGHFRKEDSDLLNLLYLVNLKDDPTKRNKFLFKIKNEIQNKSHNINSYFLNLNLLLSSCKIEEEFKKNDQTSFLINIYDECNRNINTAFTVFNDLIFNVENPNYLEYYKRVSQFYDCKTKLKKDIKTILDKKTVYVDTYNLLIIQYSYESIFKKENSGLALKFSIEETRDILKEHYISDKFLIISYLVSTDELIVEKSSRDLLFMVNKNLETFLPGNIKHILKKKFVKSLHKNIAKFNFDLIYKTDDDFVKILNLFCKVMFNFNDDKIYIYCNYSILEEEYFITVSKFDNNELNLNSFNSDEYIKFMTPKIGVLFGVNSNVINFLYNQKLPLILLEILTIKSQRHLNEEDTLYELNFNKIDENKNFKKIVNLEKNYNKNDLMLAKFIENIISKRNDYIEIKMKFIKNFSDQEFVYKIYRIKLSHASNSDNSNENTIMSIKSNIIQNVEEKENLFSEIYSSSQTSNNVYNNTVNLHNKRKVKKDKNNLIKNYTIFMIFFNVLIIFYCVIFLMLGMIEGNDYKAIFNFRSEFDIIRYSFYQTSANMFLNGLIYKENTTDISNYFEVDFFEKFVNIPEIKIDVAYQITLEYQNKLDIMKKQIDNFEKLVFDLADKYSLNDYFKKTTDFFKMRLVEDEWTLESNPMNFLDSLKLYINHAYNAYEPGETFTSIWYISQYKGKYDFSNIIDKNLKKSQIAFYEIFINYQSFFKEIESMKQIFLNLSSDFKDEFYQETMILYYCLIILNLIFFGIVFYLLKMFYDILNYNNREAKEILTKENIEFIQRKLKILEDFNKLYSDVAIIALKNLRKLKSDYLKSKKAFSLSHYKEKDLLENSKHFSIQSKSSNKNDLISFLIKPLLFNLVFLAIYKIIIFLLFQILFNNLILLTDYSTLFWNTQTKMINNLILLETIIVNNQTDKQLANFYEIDDTEGYVQQNIRLSYDGLNNLKKFEANSILSEFETIKRDLLNCSLLYSTEDDVYASFGNDTAKIIESLPFVCKSYNFMNEDDIYRIENEILYITQNLLDRFNFNQYNYTAIKAIWDDFIFFDVFVINLFIQRPLVNHLYTYHISTKVTQSIESYLLFNIIHLLLNILVDFVIFINIYFNVIMKIKKVEMELKEYLKCIRD